MKLDTPKAIIIGAIIIVLGIFFTDAYSRQLSYNKCVRILNEDPPRGGKYSQRWWIEKACEWNVYVTKGNWNELVPRFEK